MSKTSLELEVELEALVEQQKEEYCNKLFEIILAHRIEQGNVSNVLSVLRSGFPEIFVSLRLKADKRKWPHRHR